MNYRESDLLWQGYLEGQAQEIDGYILLNDAPEDFLPISGKLVNVKVTKAHNKVGQIIIFNIDFFFTL